MTADTHESGSTRLAEAARLLGLSPETVVVNVQGDEPLIETRINRPHRRRIGNNGALMATAACEIHDFDEFFNPNVVKVVLAKAAMRLFQPRTDSVSARHHARRKA